MKETKCLMLYLAPALLLVLAAGVLPVYSLAYSVPRDNTQAEYLYVFGPKGNPYDGAEDVDHQQVVFVNVPENTAGDVVIEVYDPDTGGFRDQKPSPESTWNTVVEFLVYGDMDTLLASKSFGESPEWDRKYYTFGPFKKEDGKKVANAYQFKLVANALEGEDQNLFSLRIYPENAEAFSDKVSFRLLPRESDKMYFYAQIPAGVSSISAENYDLDPDGGSASLEDPLTGKTYKVAESNSSKWASTILELGSSEQPRSVTYVITKKTQRYANAAVRVKDDKGNILPLYYAMNRQASPAPRRMPPAKVAPDIKCNRFTFDATGSYDPNREKLSYLWDFGDGATSSAPVVTHAYDKGGEYTVTLKVTDTSGLECDTSVSTQQVKVNTPPQAHFSAPQTACNGSAVMLDASASSDDTPDALTYAWDFGDGTIAEGKTVSKTYEKGGTHKVSLIVNDNSGTQCNTGVMTREISINSPPAANAGNNIDMCFAKNQELTVGFNAGRSHDPDADALTYEWDFGDGKTASGESVAHTYARPGDYTAVLTVDDGRKSTCSSANAAINVKLNRKPIANAGNDIVTCTGNAVTFNGSKSQGDSLKYAWDFGDGEKDDGVRASHSYAKGGHYKAILKVDDGKNTRCSVATSAVNVFVNGEPSVSLNNAASACFGNTVKFIASARDSDADPLLYTWDFGDGTIVEGGAAESHEYAKGGAYRVQVTVDDKKGTACSTASAISRIKINSRPIANAGPNLVCCLDKNSVFDGSGSSDPDGDTLSYHWDFGDGKTAEGAKVSHAYNKSGNYKVVLTVDDNSSSSCSSASSSFEAHVNASPVSVIKVK